MGQNTRVVLTQKKKKQTRNCNTIKRKQKKTRRRSTNRGGERLDAEIESNLTYIYITLRDNDARV